MWRAALVCWLVSFPSFAVSNLDVGLEHRMMGGTVINAVVRDASERLRLAVKSYPAAEVTLTVLSVGRPAQTVVVSAGGVGWLGAGAPLLVSVPAGVVSVSFSVPQVTPGDARYDVDVDVVDAQSVVKHGRIFSLRWEFDSGSYVRLTNAAFYVRVPVGAKSVVWQLALAGLAGWQFQVMSNRIGVEPPSSARSVPMATNWLRGEYEVYLEPPDVELSPDAAGFLTGVSQLNDGLRVSDSSAGTLSIDVDLDGDGVVPSTPRERLFAVRVPGGAYDVVMSWRDGLGQQMPAGRYTGYATLATDEVHFTAVDVEYCRPGVRLFQLTDAGLSSAEMSWDDTLIDDGTIPLNFANGLSSGLAATPAQAALNAHAWGSVLGSADGPGNQSFIDTWASATTARVAFQVVTGTEQDALPRRDDPTTGQGYVTPRPDAGLEAGAPDAGVDAGAPDAGLEPVDAGLLVLPPPVAAGARPVMDDADAGEALAPLTSAPGFSGGGGCSSTPVTPLLALVLALLARRRAALLLAATLLTQLLALVLAVLARRRAALVALTVLAATPVLAFDSETLTPLRLTTVHPTLLGTGARPSELSLTTGYSRNAVLFADQPVVVDLFSTWLAGALRVLPTLSLEAGLGLLVGPTGSNTLWSGARLSDAMLGARWRVGAVGPVSWALHAHGRIPTSLTPDFVAGSAGGLLGATTQLDAGRVQVTLDLTGAALTARRSHVRAQLGAAVSLLPSLWLGAEADVLVYVQPREDVRAAVPVELRGSLRWVGAPVAVGLIGGVGLTNGVGAPDARVMLTAAFVWPDAFAKTGSSSLGLLAAQEPSGASSTLRAPAERQPSAPRPSAPTPLARIVPAQAPTAPSPSSGPSHRVRVTVQREDGAAIEGVRVSPSRGGCEALGAAQFDCSLTPGDRLEVHAVAAAAMVVSADERPTLLVTLRAQQPDFHVEATQATLELEVFFETASDEIRPSAAVRLEALVRHLRAAGPGVVVITAHADVRGDERDNLLLSVRRGDAVRNWLRAHGVAAPLVVEPRGEFDARVARGSSPALEVDRRVHVTLPGVP